LKTHPTPNFTRKAIHNIWAQNDRKQWKRNADQLISAKILLEEARKPGRLCEGSYEIEPISIELEDGFEALAWSLPEMIQRFGGRIREIQLDSACKCSFNLHGSSHLTFTSLVGETNGSRFELYALLGEVYGSGLPLGFLLLQSQGGGAKGGTERVIRQFLRHFKTRWDLSVIRTHSDKNMSEINSLRGEFPSSKHQLCFWHVLRAVKTRLQILRRTPAYYNVADAKDEFPWIDEGFVPLSQTSEDSQDEVSLIADSNISSTLTDIIFDW
jgi:hypothetical protein